MCNIHHHVVDLSPFSRSLQRSARAPECSVKLARAKGIQLSSRRVYVDRAFEMALAIPCWVSSYQAGTGFYEVETPGVLPRSGSRILDRASERSTSDITWLRK